MEFEMKTLSISAVIVAGFLVAVGSGVMGSRNDETAKESCCLTKPAPTVQTTVQAAGASEGSCCSSSTQFALVNTDVAKEDSCGSCCASKDKNVLTSTDATSDKKECAAGTCCSSKQEGVLTSTDAPAKKECAAGTCCSSKQEGVLTSTDATAKKECAAGTCCSSKQEGVLTSTDATAKKECAAGTCCESKKAAVLTSTEAGEKACDGKDCKPSGECCASKNANVLTSAAADDKKCEEGKCAEGTCPVSAAMEKLPKMTFAVGTERVCCGEKAQALAEEHKAPIQYVVAEKTYECKNAAMTALVEETESFVAAFVAPKKCEASGNVSVAGKATACPVEAEKQATLVSTAVEKIEMQYEVAGEKAACSACAATMAKEKSAPIQYVVGEQKTSCELSARMNLARAKYKAAVQATVSQVATEANAG
jgi:hypothetical protein